MTSYLVRMAYSLCLNFRQTDVVKLSFLDQFIEHIRIMFNLVVVVASRWLEQIEPLRPTQGFEDVVCCVDSLCSLYRQFLWKYSALTERKVRSAYSGYFSYKRATRLKFATVKPCP
jgi:hypothetical protein